MASSYVYEALLPGGEIIKGTFYGSQDEFEQMLHKKKLILINFKEKKEKIDNSPFRQDDFLGFIEELYYLVNSGMPIDNALKTLLQTTKKESYREFLTEILTHLKSGTQLSIALQKALKKTSLFIDTLSISFIATAEEVGNLEQGLLQLFEYLTFQKKIRSDIKQALSYPLFLIGMSVVVSFIIFFLIIPRFAAIFSPEEFKQLPTLSHTVLSMGQYLHDHMAQTLFVVSIVILSTVIALKYVQIPWMSLFYRIPILSTVIIDLQLSIVYEALSTMLFGGLQLDKALRQLQNIKLLPELNELLKTALYEIKRGQKLSYIFSVSSIIPPTDIALVHVGENSASLAEVFHSLSVRHSESFNTKVKKILAILEPAVIVTLGLFIAIIVVAIMMAVMSMTDIAG